MSRYKVKRLEELQQAYKKAADALERYEEKIVKKGCPCDPSWWCERASSHCNGYGVWTYYKFNQCKVCNERKGDLEYLSKEEFGAFFAQEV